MRLAEPREIDVSIRRSNTVVQTFVRGPGGYNTTCHPGGRSSLTTTTAHRIARASPTGQHISSQLVRAFDLPVSPRTVRGLLACEDTLRYVKRESSPVLTKAHKTARLGWTRALIVMGTRWESVIFFDEKKFNLDGNGGLQYY